MTVHILQHRMERIPEHSLVLPTNGDDSDKISRYEHAPSHRRTAASGRHHLATVKNSLGTSNRKPPHRGALHLHERSRSLNPVQVQIFLSPEIFYVRAVPYYNDSGMEELEHFSEEEVRGSSGEYYFINVTLTAWALTTTSSHA